MSPSIELGVVTDPYLHVALRDESQETYCRYTTSWTLCSGGWYVLSSRQFLKTISPLDNLTIFAN